MWHEAMLYVVFVCDGVVLGVFFFFNDTATTEIYTLSLHDALPICRPSRRCWRGERRLRRTWRPTDRKSTRLNSSHQIISYAVFCLKKTKPDHIAAGHLKSQVVYTHNPTRGPQH